jgi:hypothetical protein
MKRLKTLTMTALALVILFSAPSAAQTVPTLAATVGAPTGFGALVTLQWSALPLAQGYTLEAGVQPGVPALTYSVPASITQVSLFAPNGTYYVRVRGFAGSVAGEFSAVQTVVVGGPVTCGTLVAPTVTAAGAPGLQVNVNWSPVAGATGYMVEYSRFNGITELAEASGPAVNSVTKYAGMWGNFYVRVVAHNACGEAAASPYVPFEIVYTPGPRTPDPAEGQLIPRATLGYLRDTVLLVAQAYPNALADSCGSRAHNFLNLLLRELRKRDSRWGLNLKRGNEGLSHDIVAYNPTNRADEGARQIYLFDVISSHDTHCDGSGRPSPNWSDVTDVTWAAGAAGACSNFYCASWTLESYLRAGYPPDPRQ